MDRGTDYCRSKVTEYERRAQHATDEHIRTFLFRMRDSWVVAAKDFARVGSATPARPKRIKVNGSPG
jgi:hypothetical protein